jgi:hypothetical protein
MLPAGCGAKLQSISADARWPRDQTIWERREPVLHAPVREVAGTEFLNHRSSSTREWTEAAGFPYAGTYHSMEEVGKNVFARLATESDGYRAEVDQFYDAGDTIIVTGRYLGTYKKSGGVMDAVFAHIWNFKDGKIVKYTQNVDTKKVWDAIEGK